MHTRQTIREFFITKIKTGVTLVNGRVEASRVFPIEKGKTPAIIVYTKEETSEAATIGTMGSSIRELILSIEIYAKGVTQLDDMIDSIAAQIEETFGVSCKPIPEITGIDYESFTTEYNGEGDQPFLVGTIEYSVMYWINNDDPQNEG